MLYKLIKSKTILFGLLLTFLGGLQSYLPVWEQLLNPNIYGSLTAIIGIIVMVLRFLTTVPLLDK